MSSQKNDPERIQLIYSSDYHDGFLSGEIQYKGKKYWAECFMDEIDYRIFKIYDLTKEEWDYQDKIRRLFEKHVAKNLYDKKNNKVSHLNKNSNLDQFYKSCKEIKEIPKKLNVSIGYFDSPEFRFREKPYRDYLIEGESRLSIHGCSGYNLIEWSYNPDFLAYEYWEKKGRKNQGHWVLSVDSQEKIAVDFCPWCGVELPTRFSPPVDDASHNFYQNRLE